MTLIVCCLNAFTDRILASQIFSSEAGLNLGFLIHRQILFEPGQPNPLNSIFFFFNLFLIYLTFMFRQIANLKVEKKSFLRMANFILIKIIHHHRE